MKKDKLLKAILAFVVLLAAVSLFVNSRYRHSASAPKTTEKELYYCPMHPNFTSDKPGDCAICGMSLVKREKTEVPATGQPAEKAHRKILFYRNPMNPQATSPVPMKDEMGMDYVPVYEDEKTAAHPGVYINPAKQQLIGVKKEKVQNRRLAGEILTVGRVAYDPSLFIAQEEYLQALKGRKIMQKEDSSYAGDQSESLIKAAKRKLLLLGMSDAEIDELAKQGKVQQNLYLPGKDDKNVWVYITVYEYEVEFIKTGLPVEVETPAYPGKTFEGTIISVAPILDPVTRSFKVRALVNNPENKLKLEMFVNVRIKYDLGEKLAVPEDAVMYTGTTNIVFIAMPDGYFEPRTVKLGAKAQGYYEVLDGLKANEDVVTSGNFLVDSESKLNAVLSQMADANR